ncbi:hypothetical protein PMAYCL1PPCAC_11543 [Pristionchus mayeri]|uniref:RING-type domain-containing protein n=1 Tax=Pristionchus mayeri TaxID=1317129 RepID=A0AAN4ZHH6_9BILA|nr:hypothetical protein PMAYCL1PPCAC_11543 [Pristionchus mayeri]
MGEETERLRRALVHALEDRVQAARRRIEIQAEDVGPREDPVQEGGEGEGEREAVGDGQGLFARVRQMASDLRGGGVVTGKMMREARALRERDENVPSCSRFSRCCIICYHPNPRQRAVFVRCGHIVCYPCAVDYASKSSSGGKCVYCRSTSGFVKIFETECAEGEEADAVIYEKREKRPIPVPPEDSIRKEDDLSPVPVPRAPPSPYRLLIALSFLLAAVAVFIALFMFSD